MRQIAPAKSQPTLVVGRWRGRYLRFAGQQFVLLAAPARSGKGVGIMIPNLLTYSDSVVVLDIKQENFRLTAGFRRAHGQAVYLFNPFAEDGRTHRYNPLSVIADGMFRVGDILAIGYVLYPAGGMTNSGKTRHATFCWDWSCCCGICARPVVLARAECPTIRSQWARYCGNHREMVCPSKPT